MPTGYTSIIEDGETTFEQYVWRCARAFGALVMLREEPLTSELPPRAEPSDFYAKSVAKSDRARLLELESLSAEGASAMAQTDHEQALERWEADHSKQCEIDQRYEKMLIAVEAWQPPTPDHAGLKSFMAKQIRTCYPVWKPERPVQLDGETWLAAQLAEARRHLAYSQKSLTEEIARTNERNAWVDALRASVPPP